MIHTVHSPFDPASKDAYQHWRDHKLDTIEKTERSFVEITNPDSVSREEHQALSAQMHAFNLAAFKITSNTEISHDALKSLGSQLGMTRTDKNLYANEQDISELKVIDKGRRGEYIPYTNRALGWHTDGYYNAPENTIRSFILYSINKAQEGGVNQLLDPDLVYIHLREHDEQLIEALMRPDTFTIPETVEGGEIIRPEQSNPVFQVDPTSGQLLMRYTRRKTHIKWHDDEITQSALSLLGDLLDSDSAHILEVQLNPGEGLICNNVLHNRSAFTDNPENPRIMLRARYYDRFKEYSDA